MKMTNIEAYEALARMNTLRETGRLGYAIAKNMRKIREEIQEYLDKRDEAAMRHGEVTPDGRFRVEPENVGAYLQEFAALNDIENDIDIMTVDTETFCGGGLTAQDMYALAWMETEA